MQKNQKELLYKITHAETGTVRYFRRLKNVQKELGCSRNLLEVVLNPVCRFPREISITREEFHDLIPPDEKRRKSLLEEACWEYLRDRFGNHNPSSYCVFIEQIEIRAQKFLREVAKYNSDLGKLHRDYINAGRGVTLDYFGLRKKPWQKVLNRLGDALPYIIPDLSIFALETMFFPTESTPEELSMAWNIIAEKIGLGDNM